MRVLLFLVLLLGVSQAYRVKSPVPVYENIINAFEGYFDGLNEGGYLHHIPQCLHQFVPVIKQFIGLFDADNFKDFNINKLFKFLSKVCGTLKEIALTLRPCIKVGEDFTVLADKFKSIDFDKLLNGLLLKIMSLYAHISEAIQHFTAADYRAGGVSLGKATYLLLFQGTSFKFVNDF